MVKVAINGFGRIGRLAFRQMFDAEGYEVVAINDLTSPKMLAHLLKYDTAQGSFCGKIGENKHTVEATEDSIIVDGKEIKIYASKDAEGLPLGRAGRGRRARVHRLLHQQGKVHGAHRCRRQEGCHLCSRRQRPAHHRLQRQREDPDQGRSRSSPPLPAPPTAWLPMADTLNKAYPIVSGIMTTVHAYTGDQMILDGPQRKGDLRRARAGAQNIVPNSTGAAKAIGLVIPELNGKLIGSAQRVPVPTGSTTILVAVVKGKDVTKDEHQRRDEGCCFRVLRLQRGADRFFRRHRHAATAPCSMPPRPWSPRSTTTPIRCRSCPGTTTRTATPAQMVRTIKYFAEL